ncbi:hypothetical protein [Lentzea terrae]|uniref:hypothetical protein n=1 Tax=Lentzea terrae TaxID=2200761 RepID=UPI000DD3C99E|nr:hypothetical protein [Lentzea terrae]
MWDGKPADAAAGLAGDRFAIARAITGAELSKLPRDLREQLRAAAATRVTPVLGITAPVAVSGRRSTSTYSAPGWTRSPPGRTVHPHRRRLLPRAWFSTGWA